MGRSSTGLLAGALVLLVIAHAASAGAATETVLYSFYERLVDREATAAAVLNLIGRLHVPADPFP
jgi:hypothetical protein